MKFFHTLPTTPILQHLLLVVWNFHITSQRNLLYMWWRCSNCYGNVISRTVWRFYSRFIETCSVLVAVYQIRRLREKMRHTIKIQTWRPYFLDTFHVVYNAMSQKFVMAVSVWIKTVDKEYWNFCVQSEVYVEIPVVLDVIPCWLISVYSLGLPGPEDEDTMIAWNVSNYLPIDVA